MRCATPPPLRRGAPATSAPPPWPCLRRGGTPGACPGPGHGGGRAAGHVPVRQVPQGEERQGAHRPDRAGAGCPPAARPPARARALGEIGAAATTLARDLVNEPANVVTPTSLAEHAREIARAGRLRVRVLDREECAKLGMGAFLGVAQGSQEPPQFIHLTYAPRRRARRKVAIIGKGITFDSGGLDLKSADGMLRMKDDMSGAAAVLGLFQALPQAAPTRRGPRSHRRHREHAVGHRPAAGRHRPRHERAHHRDRQYRRRGPAHAGRRARPTRPRRSSPTRWSTWPP